MLPGLFDSHASGVNIRARIIHCQGNVQSADDGALLHAQQHQNLLPCESKSPPVIEHGCLCTRPLNAALPLRLQADFICTLFVHLYAFNSAGTMGLLKILLAEAGAIVGVH